MSRPSITLKPVKLFSLELRTVKSPSFPIRIEDTADESPKTIFIINGLLFGNFLIAKWSFKIFY